MARSPPASQLLLIYLVSLTHFARVHILLRPRDLRSSLANIALPFACCTYCKARSHKIQPARASSTAAIFYLVLFSAFFGRQKRIRHALLFDLHWSLAWVDAISRGLSRKHVSWQTRDLVRPKAHDLLGMSVHAPLLSP
jgi:hypothetical protein